MTTVIIFTATWTVLGIYALVMHDYNAAQFNLGVAAILFTLFLTISAIKHWRANQ